MTTSKKSTLISTFTTLLSLVVITLPHTASAFSAAGDFSASSNPNGVWSYGYSYGAGSTFILDTTNTAAYNGLALGGWLGNVDSQPGNGYPYALHNGTANPVVNNIHTVYQPGQLGLQPGSSNLDSVVRWTASSSGLFTIAATFSGLSSLGDSADVHILLDGTSIFGSTVGSPATYSGLQNISAGDTVDFIVGNGGNGNAEDTTGLSATIVPEPGTLELVAMSLAGLLSFRFLKRK